MNMHNPAHPGELLTSWLEDLGVSVTAKDRKRIKRMPLPVRCAWWPGSVHPIALHDTMPHD